MEWLKKISNKFRGSEFSPRKQYGNQLVLQPRCYIPPSEESKTWYDFTFSMAMHESSDNYRAKNRYGYLGRYQFGLARLTDLGMCERIQGSRGFSNKSFRWCTDKGFSETLFLSSHALQDEIFALHVGMHRKYILRRYVDHIGHRVNGVEISLSGAIACFHLLGHGGFKHFLQGEDTSDANGTMASDYIEDFANYLIPSSLPISPKNVDLKRYCENIS